MRIRLVVEVDDEYAGYLLSLRKLDEELMVLELLNYLLGLLDKEPLPVHVYADDDPLPRLKRKPRVEGD